MREIKFRGLRIDGKGWVYGNLMEYEGTFYITPKKYSSKPVENFEVIPESVGQFTGLTDKNGVEIYEGDIVSFWKVATIHSSRKKVFAAISYGFGTFNAKNDVLNYSLIGITRNDGNIFRECEAIGNIHENQELI